MKFSEIINSDTPVLVDFFATWCGPCKAQAPILEQVKKKLGESARIVKIDVDINQAVAQAYNVMSIPTLIVFKNGEPVWRKSGVSSAAELEKVLTEN